MRSSTGASCTTVPRTAANTRRIHRDCHPGAREMADQGCRHDREPGMSTTAMVTAEKPVRVGHTELFAPRVGLGTAVLGNFQQAISDDDAIAVIDQALHKGIRYIDTAPLYGHGLAEQRVGRAIAATPREELVVSTKVGRLLRADAPRDDSQYHDGIPFYKDVPATGPVWDFSYDGVRRSVEESLQRTGIDRFDVLHMHDPDDHLEEASTTAYRALRDLRAEGLVTAIGAGMNRSA